MNYIVKTCVKNKGDWGPGVGGTAQLAECLPRGPAIHTQPHIHYINPAQRHTLWKRVDEGRGWMKVKVGFEISLT